MFKRKHSEADLTKAILLILDQNMSYKEVSRLTAIPVRTLQRYKNRYIEDKEEEVEVDDGELKSYPAVFKSDSPGVSRDVQQRLDATMLARAKFLDDVLETKQVLLNQLRKEGKRSKNIDALQRSIKTLTDIEKDVAPDGDPPVAHAKTVNVFQLFNQQLLQNGYKGPELTDADIVKGD